MKPTSPRRLSALLALSAVAACRHPPAPRATRPSNTAARPDACVERAVAAPALDLAPVVAVAALPAHDATASLYNAIGAAATQLAADVRAGCRTAELADRLRALRGEVLEARETFTPSVQREEAARRGAADVLAGAGLERAAAALRAGQYGALDRALAERILRAPGAAEWEATLDTVGTLRDAARGEELHQALSEQVDRARSRVARLVLLRALVGLLRDEPAVQAARAELERAASPESLDQLAQATDAALARLNPAQRAQLATSLTELAALRDAERGPSWISDAVGRGRGELAAMAYAAQPRLPSWALLPDPPLDAGVIAAGLTAALAALDRAIEQATGARPTDTLTPAEARAAVVCRGPVPETSAEPSGVTRIAFDGRVVDLAARAVVGAFAPVPGQYRDGDEVFRLCGDGVLSAQSLVTGQVRWSVPASAECWSVMHDAARVYCLAPASLVAHARADGRAVTLFESPASPIASTLLLGETAVLLLEDGALRFVRLTGGARVREVPAPAFVRSAPRTQLIVAHAAELICARREYEDHDQLECYDARGASRWTREVPTSEVRRHGEQDVRDPTLRLSQVGHTRLLYTTTWGPPDRSVVIELADGRVAADLPVRVSGLVERSDGGLEGLLTLERDPANPASDPLLRLREPTTGAERFRADVRSYGDTSTALLQGSQLDVAVYSSISTRAVIVALDLRTGALLWRYMTGAVVRGHSEYTNTVMLEQRGGDLLVRGFEAGGSYLAVLDPATGARRMLVLPEHCSSPDRCIGW